MGRLVLVADLAAFLNSDTLTALWPGLFLPSPVRQAWEDRHLALRAPCRARYAGRGSRRAA